ncbi:hypothetical protein OG858_47065 (plasmid) [Streptomyces europaeiscabiei]|uniref:hypothetical protein n=1 Tax=Streptomyces europaeiscabiei TaxID=146819 RepID=UPI002E805166|nr:hypothetical protein [Streptomyces europaeiscabiei]WUD38869.1 hypothetical protein OG858_47065 [Streptomyces europaeiscabiei]
MLQVSGVKPFVVVVDDKEDLQALDAVVSEARRAELAWLAAARKDAGIAWLRGTALSEARRQIRVEQQRLREDGTLYGTKDLVMTRAVRAELHSRRMLTAWPDPPPGETSAPGRRWGISPDPWALLALEEKEEEGEEKQKRPRLSFKLPAALGETLVRAAYWTSAPIVAELQAWDKRWGDGPTVILREAMRRNGGRVTDLDVMVAMLAPRPEAGALEDRARLRAQIVTTGTLARDALARAIR